MTFSAAEVKRLFDIATVRRATAHVTHKQVTVIDFQNDTVDATVLDDDQRYTVHATLAFDQDELLIDSHCDCGRSSRCEHVLASLLTALNPPVRQGKTPAPAVAGSPRTSFAAAATAWARPGPASPPAATGAAGSQRQMAAWLNKVDGEVSASHDAAGLDDGAEVVRLACVLTPSQNGNKVVMHICRASYRHDGKLLSAASVSDVQRLQSDPLATLSHDDQELLAFYLAQAEPDERNGAACEPVGKVGCQMIDSLLQKGHLLWTNSMRDLARGVAHPLRPAPARSAALHWRSHRAPGDDDLRDMLRLAWHYEPEPGVVMSPEMRRTVDYVLPTEPPWYIDNLSCGELIALYDGSLMPIKTLNDLVVAAPLLDADSKLEVTRLLAHHAWGDMIPLPPHVTEHARTDIVPVVRLALGNQPVAGKPDGLDFAVLSFDYDGERVGAPFVAGVRRLNGQKVERIVRDRQFEETMLTRLQETGLAISGTVAATRSRGATFILPDDSSWLRFVQHALPQLVEAGWQIDYLAGYRFNVQHVEDWYVDLDEFSPGANGQRGFFIELGVVVNDERVFLFPLLADLVQTVPDYYTAPRLAQRPEDDQLLLRLDDGTRLALPLGRVRKILSLFNELYYIDNRPDRLFLLRLDVARLAALENSMSLSWDGGDELRQFGRKLADFGGIDAISQPAGLQAEMRDYQLSGLAWMQFLREYDLAGVLADDMGLGKTLQALSHIQAERLAGRLDRPALIVAPTSLISNWHDEAKRFLPDLKVLILHGRNRLELFDQIDHADIVLTTYALLPRDEDKLCEHEYHLLILDEAQTIKNPRSKAAHSAQKLLARHRLCLSGTPLENHLGELWAQFNFLMPGLLGDEKTFNHDFRIPIERRADQGRRDHLIQRIKPFLLRRTKDAVAKELPAKTEMVRLIELSGPQRELYETVRAAMDRRVHDEVEQKGLARSHIVILDALLKLRQICCDPRLFKDGVGTPKIDIDRSAIPSAKLLQLLDMIQSLKAEGRRVLVFSQFTSMLALIATELKRKNIRFLQLTGETQDRGGVVAQFQTGTVPVFLVSLKAGGVGLNLTAADTVIHFDPWWNPAAQNQATDRAWRIGQDRAVFVYKMIARGTVEEKILELQARKSELANALLAPSAQLQELSITREDLQAIFMPLEE